MLTRRAFAKLSSAVALGACGSIATGAMTRAAAQSAPVSRGSYLIKNGSVITVDPVLGTLPRADVLVRDGRIEAGV